MKKVVYFIFLAMISFGTKIYAQETVLEKRTRFFNNYMKEQFPEFKITDGEYFFILPGGCVPCNKAALKILLGNTEEMKKRFQAVLFSQKTLKYLSDTIKTLHSTTLIDTTNKLDRMSFGMFGIGILKIKDQKIIGIKNLTAEDYKQGIIYFLNKEY
ncbi:MAG: hypothetical protein H6Q25_411 [Bacteroidetes bacterium]|nr:hypothetical protein [Bacteroidota bacterium]